MRTMEGRVPFTSALIIVWVLGCAVRTKPAEIADLERLREDPTLLGSARRAFELIVAADDFLLRAREEWDHREDKRARAYALMGQIKMKTALAIIEQEREKVRLAAVSIELEQADREKADLGEELAAVQEQLSIMGQLRTMEAQLADERRALDAVKKQTATERRKLADQLASEKRHVAALDAIRAADVALKTAETVESSRYAKAKYLVAADMLQKGHQEFDAARWDEAIARATLSRAEAVDASQIARPLFEQAERVKSSRARDRDLEAAASALPGVRMRLDRDEDLQRLVLALPQLFADKGAVLLPTGAKVLDAVAELLARFPTYPLQVSPSSDDRDRLGNLLAPTLARSNATFWALVARGIDPRRISIGAEPAVPASARSSGSERIQNPLMEISILYHIFDP